MYDGCDASIGHGFIHEGDSFSSTCNESTFCVHKRSQTCIGNDFLCMSTSEANVQNDCCWYDGTQESIEHFFAFVYISLVSVEFSCLVKMDLQQVLRKPSFLQGDLEHVFWTIFCVYTDLRHALETTDDGLMWVRIGDDLQSFEVGARKRDSTYWRMSIKYQKRLSVFVLKWKRLSVLVLKWKRGMEVPLVDRHQASIGSDWVSVFEVEARKRSSSYR